MRIGYQGIEGSNSNVAAAKMAERLGIAQPELVPLVSAPLVFGALKRGEVDYGVVAVKNSIGGAVRETMPCLFREPVRLRGTEILAVDQSLFKKPGVPTDALRHVVSHEQAYLQCAGTLAARWPQLEPLDAEKDTALAARKLSEGQYGDDTAVICRREAGELFGLELVCAGISDEPDNRTEFRLYSADDKNSGPSKKALPGDRLLYAFVDEATSSRIAEAIIVLSILIALLLPRYTDMGVWDVATGVAGAAIVVLAFIGSARFKNGIKCRMVKGYWTYYSAVEAKLKESPDQFYTVPRVVEIDCIGGQAALHGWICDKEQIPMFRSEYTVLVPDENGGTLIYRYGTPRSQGRGVDIGGLVELTWETGGPAVRPEVMLGNYYGIRSKEFGNLIYRRIDKAEFDALRGFDYL